MSRRSLEDEINLVEEKEPMRKNKRRRTTEVIDLVDQGTSRHSRRAVGAPGAGPSTRCRESPISIEDDEPGPSRPRPTRANTRSASRGHPTACHPERWGEIPPPSMRTREEDFNLARRLQAEEEAEQARQHRRLQWRLEALEREEAAAEAANPSRSYQRSRSFLRRNAAAGANTATDRRRQHSFGPPGRAFVTTGPRSNNRRGRNPSTPQRHPSHPFPMFLPGALLFGGLFPFSAFDHEEDGEDDSDNEGMHGFGNRYSHFAALQHAISGARSGALPPELLFSDRDFNEEDYEALLALDEGVDKRQGATQTKINQLACEKVPRGESEDHYNDCPICLEKISGGQFVRKLECGHPYHKGCVDKWLKQKACCPICQRKVF